MSYGDVSWVNRVFHAMSEKNNNPHAHYRICANPACGKIILEEQCLDWKHPTGARFCPKCHEVTEEINKDDIEIITCPACNGWGITNAWYMSVDDCPRCDGDSFVIVKKETAK